MKGLLFSAALLLAVTPGVMAQQDAERGQETYGRYVLWLTDDDIEQLKSNPIGLASKIPENLRGQIGEVVVRYQKPADPGLPDRSENTPVRTNKPQNDFPSRTAPGANDRVANSNRYDFGSTNTPQNTLQPREPTFEERLAEMQRLRDASSTGGNDSTGATQPDWRTNRGANGFEPNFNTGTEGNNSVLDRTNRREITPRTNDFNSGAPTNSFQDFGDRPTINGNNGGNNQGLNELDREIQYERTRGSRLEAERLAAERARNDALLAEIRKERDQLEKERYLQQLRNQNRTYVEDETYRPGGFEDRLASNGDFALTGSESTDSAIDYSPRRVGLYGRQLLDYDLTPAPSRERTASLPKSNSGIGGMSAMIPANNGSASEGTVPTSNPPTSALARRTNVTEKTNGFLWFMLLCSVGLNVYLSWIARGFYVRYNELADELRETFTATM